MKEMSFPFGKEQLNHVKEDEKESLVCWHVQHSAKLYRSRKKEQTEKHGRV